MPLRHALLDDLDKGRGLAGAGRPVDDGQLLLPQCKLYGSPLRVIEVFCMEKKHFLGKGLNNFF